MVNSKTLGGGCGGQTLGVKRCVLSYQMILLAQLNVNFSLHLTQLPFLILFFLLQP